ncbi:iron only hydrogenase large subunit, c-terminal domain-containing protein [Toxoplasma gondii MAS]|uniref:Iron only hydrogenase large subunit, c-terminal domain-containing protein n=1 Tax=Toxoplasma gondii MAS TaxID=943118 RepID=A0A086Q2N7_TOXGO|nr:iron only hydrogenase large subunit, c-terminal domain-containing protein [Toxoplasma gondii MAS]
MSMARESVANPSFSAAVKLADLDDYLAPAQSCVVPILTAERQNDQAVTRSVSGRARGNGVPGLGRSGIRTGDYGNSDRFNQGANLNDGKEYGRADLIRLVKPGRETGRAITDRGMHATGSRKREAVAMTSARKGNSAPNPNMTQGQEDAAGGEKGNAIAASTAVAKVSLYDCLACSGCVTSAEAVLLDHHSVDQFLRSVRSSSAKSITVVSLSFQSITALAHEFGSSPAKTLRRISTLFRLAGATYVLGTQVSDAIAVLEAEREFVRRYREAAERTASERAHLQSTVQVETDKEEGLSSPPTGGHSIDETTIPLVPADGLLPVLTSFCPGLVCYAEKSLHPSLLPYFSRVRSSQQIQGVLVKGLLCEVHNARSFFSRWRVAIPMANWFLSPMMKRTLSRYCHLTAGLSKQVCQQAAPSNTAKTGNGDMHPLAGDLPSSRVQTDLRVPAKVECLRRNEELTPGDIFHVCVMPCFDKKLEAARPEFRSTPMATAADCLHSVSASSGHRLLSGLSEQAGTSLPNNGASGGDTPDVDLVLATNEVTTLMERLNVTFDELDDSPVDDFYDYFSGLWYQGSRCSGPFVGEPPHLADGACSMTQWGTPEDSPLPMLGHPVEQETPASRSDNIDKEFSKRDVKPSRPSEYLSGSGGYTDRVFRRAAWELFGVKVEGPLQFTQGRNEDYKEVTLVVDGEEKLRFAIAYGFRNIRNVVQRLKREISEETSKNNSRDHLRSPVRDFSNREHTASPHADIRIDGADEECIAVSHRRNKRAQRRFPHFIELAACPGGCLNGGGQMLSLGRSQRRASKNSHRYISTDSTCKSGTRISEVTISAKSGAIETERVIDAHAAGLSGLSSVTEGKVGSTSAKPDSETQKPLTCLTDLLHSSFVFHDPLHSREIELAYRYLQGRVRSSSASIGEEPVKTNRRQWRQSRAVKDRSDGEVTVDWWQRALSEEQEYKAMYTSFKSIFLTSERPSGATMASLKW